MKKIITLLLSIMIAVNAFAELYQVSVASLNVRNKPSVESEIIGKVQKGINIEVKEVKNGFAVFDFMGNEGYASIKYLKKVEEKGAAQVGESRAQSVLETKSATTSGDERAIVYLFYDLTHYFESFPVTVNNAVTFGMEGKVKEGKLTGTRYTPSMRRLNVKGEGRMLISTDYYWADKPYHSDLTIDIADGGVYYVKIHIENLVNAVTKKRTGIYFKQLTPKEGLKELKKDKYTQNADVDITL